MAVKGENTSKDVTLHIYQSRAVYDLYERHGAISSSMIIFVFIFQKYSIRNYQYNGLQATKGIQPLNQNVHLSPASVIFCI